MYVCYVTGELGGPNSYVPYRSKTHLFGFNKPPVRCTHYLHNVKKAFDSVEKNKLFQIVRVHSIPGKNLKAIQIMYENTSAVANTPEGELQLLRLTRSPKISSRPIPVHHRIGLRSKNCD